MNNNELLNILDKLQTDRQEWNTVDAKECLPLNENGQKAEFIKDIVAMANNHEQSFLIIGLKDQTFEPVGGLAEHHSTNDLNQLLTNKLDPPIDVEWTEYSVQSSEVAVISIHGTNPPYIVFQDISPNRTDSKKVRVRKGSIYTRQGDRTVGISRSELDNLYLTNTIFNRFRSESPEALRLVNSRPQHWEYLLTSELMRIRIEYINQILGDFDKGLLFNKSRALSGKEFMAYVQGKRQDLQNLLALFSTLLTVELPKSWGEEGEPGDPIIMKRFQDKLAATCDELIEWEIDLKSIIVSGSFQKLHSTMSGWTRQIIGQLESVYSQFNVGLRDIDENSQVTIKINFETIQQLDDFTAESDRLSADPSAWSEEYW